MIELIKINKQFNGQKILIDLDLTIKRGSIISIIGPSGIGKSTLLRCIKGLEKIDNGEIKIDGKLAIQPNLNDWIRSKLKISAQTENIFDKIGYVFQDLYLFSNFTVYENIDLPLKIIRKTPKANRGEIIRDLLNMMELSDKADSYPTSLSGGQQQRIAIARTLAMNPEAILFDEPTSALDNELKAKAFKLIKNLAKQKNIAIVIVTHETELAKKYSDKVYELKNGKLKLTTN